MPKQVSLKRLLLRNTLPGQVGILGVLLLLLMVIFYLYVTFQLEDKHQAYNQQVIASLSDGVDATTMQMQALANNDFIVNSLIDFQQRDSYLPLFFQSLRINNASSASIGFFDFDGELIAGRNWSSVTLNNSSAQWRDSVLTEGQSLTVVDADGVFIVVPVLLGGAAEGALAMKADSLETFIRVERNDAIQILVNRQKVVRYSSRPDVMQVSTIFPENLMQDNVAQKREYGDLTVISYEAFGSAYASLLNLLPVLLLAMLAVAAVSSLSARLAARYAAGTLTDFQLSLENEIYNSKVSPVDSKTEDAKELQDIKRSFMQLKNELLKLSLSNDKVTSVINAMLEFLVVVDTQGNIVLCNKAYDDFCSHFVFENDTLLRLVDDFSTSLAGDEIRNSIERSYVSIENGKVVKVLWRATPHLNSDGDGIGIVIIGEDITTKRGLESDLQIKTQAIDNSATSIVISDVSQPGQPVVYANRAYEKLSGYKVKEILGRNCKSLQGLETSKDDIEELRKAIKERRVANVTILNYKKDGTKFYNRLNLTPIRNDDGNVTHYIGIQQDVTAQQKTAAYLAQAKAKAEESSKLKSGFLASMSHEIRTPINGISGMLQLLDSTELSDKQQEFVGLAATSTQNLLHLINDILDFSKIEAGKLTIENTVFQPANLLSMVIEHFAIEAAGKGLTLEYKNNFVGNLSVQADQMRIRQILNNLLSNAIKFTEKGSININARIAEREGQSFLTCAVIDTGIGISPEKLQSVFEEFHQEDVSTTRQYGGTGLGLAICRQLCELMQGTIKAVSTKGQGSQFVFSIPVKCINQASTDKEAPATQENSEIEPAVADTDMKHVLLVEDNHINQIVAQNQLLGFNVTAVENGQQAVTALTQNPSLFDVVLMDCQMPVMDGYEATRRIREGQAGEVAQHIPIIALTANAMKGDKERCIEAGMNDYISKPFQANVLIEKVTLFSSGIKSSLSQHNTVDKE